MPIALCIDAKIHWIEQLLHNRLREIFYIPLYIYFSIFLISYYVYILLYYNYNNVLYINEWLCVYILPFLLLYKSTNDIRVYTYVYIYISEMSLYKCIQMHQLYINSI